MRFSDASFQDKKNDFRKKNISKGWGYFQFFCSEQLSLASLEVTCIKLVGSIVTMLLQFGFRRFEKASALKLIIEMPTRADLHGARTQSK